MVPSALPGRRLCLRRRSMGWLPAPRAACCRRRSAEPLFGRRCAQQLQALCSGLSADSPA